MKGSMRWWREALLVLTQLHRSPPSLCITDAARDQLLANLRSVTEFEPVAALLWASEPSAVPAWHVAIYDRGTRRWGRVFTLQGIPFVFVQNRAFTHLEQATLDYSNGKFVVLGAA